MFIFFIQNIFSKAINFFHIIHSLLHEYYTINFYFCQKNKGEESLLHHANFSLYKSFINSLFSRGTPNQRDSSNHKDKKA